MSSIFVKNKSNQDGFYQVKGKDFQVLGAGKSITIPNAEIVSHSEEIVVAVIPDAVPSK